MSDRKNHIDEYLQSFRKGEEKAFNFFFNLHYASLCLFCFRIIKDKEASEEIVQDAYLKLWERHENFYHASALKSFLFTVCKNASLDWLRSRRKETLNKQQLTYISGSSETNILHHMIAAEVYADIHAAMNTLPPQCRTIFRMLFLEGKDYQQIAAELSLSVSTIRNQKARALTLLKNRINPEDLS